ncbi:hypothetical protein Taro_030436 [Colocasia esculenta]|uniref:Uncharacterized protein n=1 Tax=Colocasia esculenta TaxID=4460 RepID=A0A843VRW8_COLES|nr:hypothetical protein [Colocasia esculenta]
MVAIRHPGAGSSRSRDGNPTGRRRERPPSLHLQEPSPTSRDVRFGVIEFEKGIRKWNPPVTPPSPPRSHPSAAAATTSRREACFPAPPPVNPLSPFGLVPREFTSSGGFCYAEVGG